MHWLSYLAGAFLIALILLDVYLTVLYARMGASIISHRLASLVWCTFRALARAAGRHRDSVLSYAGPTMLVSLVVTWFSGLMLGGALLMHPALGSSIQANQGPTPTSFISALYLAGDAVTTVGASDISPKTNFYRLFYTFLSVIGISTLTLTVTYFLEIYNALQARNTYVVKMHHATAGTGDAVELVAGIGPGGHFEIGYSHLAEMAAEAAELYEAHHFYPALLYFRFAEPHYALSRAALVTLDTITLIHAALDDEKFGWLKESAAVMQVWRGAMRVITELSVVFLPGGIPEQQADEPTIQRWRERYHAAVERLDEAGIATMRDREKGAEIYVAQRVRWHRYIVAFAKHMEHSMEQIDPAGTNPTRSGQRQEFAARLRAAG